ncbi:MAG: hypothetical protein Q8M98_03230 [Candidatus Cloacimonadaceae bacterium]|nr:hypothetical protein [Candidatus Cloacimonadaceae bacterium]MDP3113768.1 hypothetical protein [Candidatus Cloacimonadaceae bacterium]
MPSRVLLIRLIILLIIALMIGSCGWNDPDDTAISEIRDILYDISVSFNFGNITGIMRHAHPDYLHKGMRDYQLRELWLDRMALYSMLNMENILISVNGERATATMLMRFQSASDTLILDEPNISGDASYFYYDGNKWRLYGNQSYF